MKRGESKQLCGYISARCIAMGPRLALLWLCDAEPISIVAMRVSKCGGGSSWEYGSTRHQLRSLRICLGRRD